jgi:hypothetical protein
MWHDPSALRSSSLSSSSSAGAVGCLLLHLLIPLWFDHLIHEITSRCNDMGGISISIYQCHSRECFVGLAGSTYHSACHTWNPNTPHTAKLLSSFRADILLYAGVPPRLDMYMANKKFMVSGLEPSISSRLAKT